MPSIDDVVRREAGTYGDLGIPPEDPERPGKWLRMPCPFCGRSGRTTAAINYEVGWFVCHACDKRLSIGYDDSAATRFKVVLRRVASKARRDFPGVLTRDEARSYANERLAVYAGPDNGSCADAGALERWQKATDSEDRLDAYVTQALNCDLIDYARKLFRQGDREVPAGAGTESAEDDVPDHLTRLLDCKQFEDFEFMRDHGLFSRDDYPVLYALKVDGMTRDEVEELLRERLGWTQAQFRERLKAEKTALARAFYQR